MTPLFLRQAPKGDNIFCQIVNSRLRDALGNSLVQGRDRKTLKTLIKTGDTDCPAFKVKLQAKEHNSFTAATTTSEIGGYPTWWLATCGTIFAGKRIEMDVETGGARSCHRIPPAINWRSFAGVIALAHFIKHALFGIQSLTDDWDKVSVRG
ncbi:hypothetical protein ARMGADRAFT_1069473 [Armillaria gallica]|uniref:Uncharacterized protein n=1 Tax=Armillaria gallica TaxID=47427 RepID=A0A2H3CLQ8_ARMGA|nr:hypothetical protein ARMGADRAFT_1069473 [Armillaria gallica]